MLFFRPLSKLKMCLALSFYQFNLTFAVLWGLLGCFGRDFCSVAHFLSRFYLYSESQKSRRIAR